MKKTKNMEITPGVIELMKFKLMELNKVLDGVKHNQQKTEQFKNDITHIFFGILAGIIICLMIIGVLQ